MDVIAHHQIVALGPDRMKLMDTKTGAGIVDAARPSFGKPWTITATGVADITADDRAAAITAMTEHALAALSDATSYTTLVPHGLPDQP